jgi:hypothetical protein
MQAKNRLRVLTAIIIVTIFLAVLLNPEQVNPYMFFVLLPFLSVALFIFLLGLWRKENESKKKRSSPNLP